MNEEWRSSPSFPEYEASSLGRVRRAKPDRYGRHAGRVMAVTKIAAGYTQCSLSTEAGRKKVLVHRLVCEAFHGVAPTAQHQAAHCDGDSANNRAANLRWATAKENEADKRTHGTIRQGERHHSFIRPECVARGSRVGTSKLTEAMVASIRADARARAEIAKEYGLCKSHVSEIRTRKVWRHV